MFKSLFVIGSFLVLINQSFAADVQCALINKRTSIPVSVDAKKAASFLGVKTCNGPRFQALIKAKGAQVTERQATEQEVAEYYASGSDKFSF